MKLKAKTFYGILAVFSFSLVLAACPPEPKPSKPVIPSINGAPSLKLSGQVYIQNIDTSFEAIMSNSISNISKYNGNLDIFDGGLGGSGEIIKGKLGYTIDEVPELSPINEGEDLAFIKDKYSSLKFTPEDVEVAAVAFEIINDGENSGLDEEYSGLFKGSLNIDLDLSKLTVKITIKMVNYVYVDRDLKITGDKYTYVNTDYGFPITLTTERINLDLKKGWNSIYEEITAQSNIPMELIPILMSPSPMDPDSPPDLSALKPTGNLKMSVADPVNLNWILIPSQPPDIPQYPDDSE